MSTKKIIMDDSPEAWEIRAALEAAYKKRVAGKIWNPNKDKAFPIYDGRVYVYGKKKDIQNARL